MREDFLHYLWRFKRFDTTSLLTTDKESVEIIEFGEYNTNAGPDFLNARLRIGDTIWAGNVEMHLRSSEWLAHKHDHNIAYDTVILHVVMEEDAVIYRSNGEKIPCLQLRPHIKEQLLGTYQSLLHNAHWIPCQHHFYTVSEMTKNAWLTRLLIERLAEKSQIWEIQLIQNQYNWEETFYQALARNFGVKVNDLPFELLAKSLPLITLGKHKDQIFQVEALLFGQAGLLHEDFEDDFPKKLKKEYLYLRQKFQLEPLNASIWKFSKLRPGNFPTIRLAQFARLVHQSVHLFSKILEAKDSKTLQELFKIELSDYWETHYVFDKTSKKSHKTLGKDTVNLLIINTIAPFLFLYGKIKNEETYKDRAIELLEQIPLEKNTIIEGWQKLGLTPDSAAQTQSLIQLKNKYCNEQRCMNCAIGIAIMKMD
jgi:Protein of unknown function (DUF2851)